MELLFTIMGVVGAMCGVSMYFMIEQDKISADSYTYYIINGIGAILVLVAVNHNFDWGDMGASLQELCWAMISVAGIYRVFTLGAQGEK